MTSRALDAALLCVDCLATRSTNAQQQTPRSVRCREHQKQWAAHLGRRRNRLQRRKRGVPGVPAPSLAAWEQGYRPRPIVAAGSSAAALLDAADLEQIANVIADLRQAHLDAGNAYRKDDAHGLRIALRNLLDATQESFTVLKDVPALHAAVTAAAIRSES